MEIPSVLLLLLLSVVSSTHWVEANHIQYFKRKTTPEHSSMDEDEDSRENSIQYTTGRWSDYQEETIRRLQPPTEEDKRDSCPPEEFHHEYLTVGNASRPMVNFWPRTWPGERATTRFLCLQPNGLPVTRECRRRSDRWDNYPLENSPRWEDISQWGTVRCLNRTQQPIATPQLSQLHESAANDAQQIATNVSRRQEMVRMLGSLLGSADYQLIPADVHLAAGILQQVTRAVSSPDASLSSAMVGICSHLMAKDEQVLRASNELNATNVLLETFERYMDDLATTVPPGQSCGGPSIFSPINSNASRSEVVEPLVASNIETVDYAEIGVRAHLSANLSVFFVNPQCAGLTGIAIYDPATPTTTNVVGRRLYREARGDFVYRFIGWNETAAEVMQEPGLLLASFVPLSLWTAVRGRLEAQGRTPMVVLKVYATDCLFVDRSRVTQRKPFSKILSVSIPGHSGPFSEILPFILHNQHNSNLSAEGTGCGYWDYSSWVSDGVVSPTSFSSSSAGQELVLCGSLHLTQFSFLVGGSYRQNDPAEGILITPIHQRALDIITLLGCSLSLLGLLGIWLTAALFRSWRALASTKVLLNLCLALTLQIVLFVFVNTDDMTQFLVVEEQAPLDCVVLGALMQYSILVLFTWMLIVAYLQFQRYVTVIGIERPKHYILKSAIAAWGFPLVPTLLVACIDPHSYVPTEHEISKAGAICYPSGHGLAFGVVLPVSLIVVANLTIFVYVFYSISHSLQQSLQRSELKMVRKQVRLSVLLFFLFGLSWIFGLFAFMNAGLVFSYLFCVTATLQGFVLFVYFVLLDEMTLQLWQKLLHCGSKSERKGDQTKARELQSMTSSTGVTSKDH